jgi:outer membrane protein assembly factor BamB
VGLFGPEQQLVGQPVILKRLGRGDHTLELAGLAPPGTWSWRAMGVEPGPAELLAAIGTGVSDRRREDELGRVAGGDAGPPCAVAADDGKVFLGWRAAVAGHEVVAVDPQGRVLWAHHHGPALSGVRGLAASDGVLFVLGSGEEADSVGTFVYKLDAATGKVVPWEGQDGADLPLVSLWGEEGKDGPSHSEAIAAKNGRLYVTFSREQFIAALDAKSGAYVITLSGPTPGQMALSTTPMTDPQNPGQMKVIDFGVCALAGNGIAYFVMEHDPAWVMASTTRWLQDDERIAALTLVGDTMKTKEVTIYTGLADPHHQVQLRNVDSAEAFSVAVGNPGGRPAVGPWEENAFRDIQALAVDSTGQLWVAEGDENFGRFSVWKTEGKQGTLLREYFGPIREGPHYDPANPTALATGSLQWNVDRSRREAKLGALLPQPAEPQASIKVFRDPFGIILWQAASMSTDARDREADWRVWPGRDGHLAASTGASGTVLYSLPAVDRARLVGSGQVRIPKRKESSRAAK